MSLRNRRSFLKKAVSGQLSEKTAVKQIGYDGGKEALLARTSYQLFWDLNFLEYLQGKDFIFQSIEQSVK
jgi:hypothetical protein